MSIPEKYFVRSIDHHQIEEWLLKKHYARRIPPVVYQFGLFEKNTGTIIGVCTYGMPPQDNCLLLCGPDYKQHAIELNRLIKNDGLEKNVQSWFVAQTFKLLPKPMAVISYADPNNGHYGYTYQALNFLYTGEGGADAEYVFRGRQYTMRSINKQWFKVNKLQFDESKTVNENFINAGGQLIQMGKKKRYVLFLGDKRQVRDMRHKLIWPVLPYDKGENKRYNTDYKTSTQASLF